MINKYADLFFQLHPDRTGSSDKAGGHEKFQELQEAYDVLRKPSSRNEYDRKLNEGTARPRQSPPPNQQWAEYQQWRLESFIISGSFFDRSFCKVTIVIEDFFIELRIPGIVKIAASSRFSRLNGK